jgi:hypothetical protein
LIDDSMLTIIGTSGVCNSEYRGIERSRSSLDYLAMAKAKRDIILATAKDGLGEILATLSVMS